MPIWIAPFETWSMIGWFIRQGGCACKNPIGLLNSDTPVLCHGTSYKRYLRITRTYEAWATYQSRFEIPRERNQQFRRNDSLFRSLRSSLELLFMRSLRSACDNIFGKGKWKSVQLPQHRSMSELWWVSGRRDEEETFELKIRKYSCGNYTERSVIVYMCWLWRESQARESAPMRVIFTRLQEQLSSRNLNSHCSTPLIGTLSRVCK